MQGGLRQLPCCRVPRPAACGLAAPAQRPVRSRGALQVVAFGKFFDNLKKGAGGGDKGQDSGEAARKALQDTFSNQKKFQNFFGQGSGGGGGDKGGQGGGGGGGGGFGSGAADDSSGGDKSIMSEILGCFRGAWVVFWNTALFLGFADLLHRSLDWCCGVELLFLVGAPQQAFERLAGRFFALIEWIEKNMLGWDIPGDEDMIPQYENIKLFYPRAHAYTFDQYRYDLTPKEKDTLINTYALRHYEREGGRPGDVSPDDIAAIYKRVNPMEADRIAYQRAVAAGRVEDYWATRKDEYKRITGQDFVRPPGVAAPPAPA